LYDLKKNDAKPRADMAVSTTCVKSSKFVNMTNIY